MLAHYQSEVETLYQALQAGTVTVQSLIAEANQACLDLGIGNFPSELSDPAHQRGISSSMLNNDNQAEFDAMLNALESGQVCAYDIIREALAVLTTTTTTTTTTTKG